MNLFLPIFLETLAKSALLVLGVAALLAALAQASAAQRHAAWLAVIVALLLLPATKLIPPRWHLPGSPQVQSVILRQAPVTIAGAPSAQAAPALPELPSWRWPEPSSLVLGVWLVGVLGVLGYRLLGSLQIARLQRCSAGSSDVRLARLAAEAAAEMRVGMSWRVRLSSEAHVPCMWSVWRPVVLLPAGAAAWSDERVLAALRHEFAHVARRDALTRWLATFTCALYWPNPLVWFAARSLRAAQEQACDDLVLRAGTPPDDYAALLLETARAFSQPGATLRAAIAMARPATLEGRVLAIVDEARNRRPAGRFASVASAAAVALIVTAGALAQVAAEKASGTPAASAHGPLVMIEAKFLELPDKTPWKDVAPFLDFPENFPEAKGAVTNVLTAAQSEQVFTNLTKLPGADVLSSPRITARSGQRATIEIIREFQYPTEWKKDGEKWLAKETATRNLGVTLGAQADVAADGTIALQLTPSVVEFLGYVDAVTSEKFSAPAPQDAKLSQRLDAATTKPPEGRPYNPVIYERKTDTTVLIPSGSTVMLGSLGGVLANKDIPGPKPERRIVVFVTARTEPEPAAAAAPQPATNAAEKPAANAAERAARIIIPKLAFSEAPLSEAVAFLRNRSAALSPDETGANLMVRPSPGVAEAKITLSLTNISLLEAARYTAQLAGLELREEPYALIFAVKEVKEAKAAAGPAEPESPALAKAEKIIVPRVEFREATVAEAVEFLRAKARQLDPEQQGVNVILKNPAGADAKLSLSLTNVPLAQALRYVAGLANLELRANANALVLQPLGDGEKPKGALAPVTR